MILLFLFQYFFGLFGHFIYFILWIFKEKAFSVMNMTVKLQNLELWKKFGCDSYLKNHPQEGGFENMNL